VIEIFFGFLAWFLLRIVLRGFFTVDQNERAVKLTFGRAERIGNLETTSDPVSQTLSAHEIERYRYPQLRVIPPGGPYFKWPWQNVRKVSIALVTVSIGHDPEDRNANSGGEVLEAVTKDNLNTGIRGQIRFNVSDHNLYAYLFGVKNPVAHVMGYFISVLRERIAIFEAPKRLPGTEPVGNDLHSIKGVQGISINDLRKNLSSMNQHMEAECKSSVARYGIALDAALVTGIDPPNDVESALAAINTAHNQVSSEISLAQASADQKIVQSRTAVEIETMRAQAEVQKLTQLADQLQILKQGGRESLQNYVRNVRLKIYSQASKILMETPS
jgi:regulator of protease activity HflC (stomatin/prohibitin superfamily)